MGTKYSEISTPASALDGTEALAVTQSSTTKKLLASGIKTYTKKNPVTAVTSASGVLTLDASTGDYFTTTLTENVTSLLFTNLTGAGYGHSLMLRITQHASSPKTFAWPASFKWVGGAAGTISATNSAVDVIAMTTFDNGASWNVTLANGYS